MEISSPQPLVDRRPDSLGDLRILPDELLCSILESLTPRDVARLSCVSSAMYIFCNEEPLWMRLCLNAVNGHLQYKGSWKKTTLFLENVPEECIERAGNPLRFNGFSSLFLYRRLYRCNTSLDGFGFDVGNVERKGNLSVEDFSDQYDGKKPVLLIGLADSWPSRTWTIDQLAENYGDTAFRISQRSVRKVSMKFKDYVSYMELQRDEDPLYIFDDKFGEVSPSLVKDYSVPHMFQEDLFEILDREQRPPYRWLIIGPQRSGASWHVDPALTSAWNTLLCGRKRWALYPPGKVPSGVTVHVNEEDGDVNIETPSSLQWWLDFYPLLADEDKPIECTQLPGETIFVPSGWWHCVLNLETTVAITQNFVNSKNFEYVCLDMAPGYRHKGVCRAGFLALDEGSVHELELNASYDNDAVDNESLMRKQKRARIQVPGGDLKSGFTTNVLSNGFDSWKQEFCYDTKFLSTFLDEDRDHYTSPWSSGNCIGQREMRYWLSKLWVKKPGMRPLVWKGACFALNADKWFNRLLKVCGFHNLPLPTDDQRLPVGTGSNPVYLLDDHAIKIFAEGGLQASMYGLGSELEFYSVLCKVNSPLKKHIPEVLFSGILYSECGTLKILPWDGKRVPTVISDCNVIPRKCEDGFLLGVWGKKQFECRKAGTLNDNSCGNTRIWPYIITKRCKGEIFAHLRDELSWEDVINLATFLGEQLRNLHLLPYPRLNSSALLDIDHNTEDLLSEDTSTKKDIPAEWKMFIRALSKKRKTATRCLINWGDPVPSALIQKVDDYIPDDFAKLIVMYQDEDCQKEIFKPCSWIHSDIMDDNVHMEPYQVTSPLEGEAANASSVDTYPQNGHDKNGTYKSWRPSHILDFSDLSIGDRLFDLIPIYLDIFRGDSGLLKQFLQSYRLPLGGNNASGKNNKFGRLSYHAMCYCILHEENILGAIFSIWKELRAAKSWEEVELSVWGELNNYKSSS